MGLYEWLKNKYKDEDDIEEEKIKLDKVGIKNLLKIERFIKKETPIKKERSTKKDNVVKEDYISDIFFTKEECEQLVIDYCEQIIESNQIIEDSKSEYQLVTAYISDIQRIEMLSLTEKEKLSDAARKIVNLNEERLKFHQSGSRITDTQFRSIERNEADILIDIKKIKDLEDYNSLIKNDMAHLEGEKAALKHDIKDCNVKQNYLKKITIVTGVLSVLLIILFSIMANIFEADMKIPYMLTIFMMAVMLTYIFVEARRNTYQIKLSEIKINRSINILNKVKIKCINNTGNLEYNYNKYMVGSSHELSYLWEEYIKAKDKENRYKQTTELLEYYDDVLIDFLKNLKLSDANIWLQQALAIIDENEMSQIKQRLEIRRNKLKDKINFNINVKDINIKKIRGIIEKNPEVKSEVIKTTMQYNITL